MTARGISAVATACLITSAGAAFAVFRVCCWAGEQLDRTFDHH